MKLILIRHADADYETDTLTKLGEVEARALADVVASEDVNAIFTSPQGRARITADYISEMVDMPNIIQFWLHELNGNFQDDLWAWRVFGADVLAATDSWTKENWVETAAYGEHMKPIVDEMLEHFDKFMRDQGYVRNGCGYEISVSNVNTVVLVCHAGVILTILSHVLNIPLPITFSQFTIGLSSQTILEMEESDEMGVFKLLAMNDMSHLRGVDLQAVVAKRGTAESSAEETE